MPTSPSPPRHDRVPVRRDPTTDRPAADLVDDDRSSVGQFITYINTVNGGSFAAARATQAALRDLGWSIMATGREPVGDDADRSAIDWFRTLVSATRDGDRTLARIAARRLYVAGFSVARRTSAGRPTPRDAA